MVDQKTAYLRTQIMTARPEQLTLMLLDGAIRFSERGRACIEAKNFEGSYNALQRAENIVLELVSSLRPEDAPDVCRRQAGLYMFVYGKLVEANMRRDVAALNDALRILGILRETWVMLMDQLQDQPAESRQRDQPVLSETGGRVSIQG